RVRCVQTFAAVQSGGGRRLGRADTHRHPAVLVALAGVGTATDLHATPARAWKRPAEAGLSVSRDAWGLLALKVGVEQVAPLLRCVRAVDLAQVVLDPTGLGVLDVAVPTVELLVGSPPVVHAHRSCHQPTTITSSCRMPLASTPLSFTTRYRKLRF